MLKRLDESLDSLGDFVYKHQGFAILSLAVVLALLTTVVTLSERSPEDTGRGVPAWEETVTLEDTRRVHCVGFEDGVSCDWTHASGADEGSGQ